MAEIAATITWLGQMGLWVRIGKTSIMIDYFASDVPRRRVPPPIPVQEVAGVDCFLGTHDHDDHIDHPAWKVWNRTCPNAKFLFPAVHRQRILADGIPSDRMLSMNVGDAVQIGDITVHAIPAAHEFLSPDEQGRYPCLQHIIEGRGVRVYHAGDTLRYEGMLPRLQSFGPITAALLPINGRDGERYRRNCIGNMTFQEAADLAGELRPALALPGHWDMFANNPGDPAAFADYLDAKYEGKIPCRIPKVMEPIVLYERDYRVGGGRTL